MKKIVYIVVLFTICTNAYAQSIVYNSAQNQKFYELFNHFSDFKILNVDYSSLWNESLSIDSQGTISLNVGEHNWKVLLTESTLLNTEYGLSKREQIISGEIATPYTGVVVGHEENSQVRLTIGRDFLYGYVRIDGKTYYFEPLSYQVENAPKDHVLFYDTHDIIPGEAKTCAAFVDNQKKKNFNQQPDLRFNSSVGNCYEVELAIASDFAMFQKYGSVAAVENHNIGVMNDVAGDYAGEFDDDIQFLIVTQFVVNCSGCDPWTNSTNSGTLLDSFRSWGNSGGFNVNFDLGQLWSNRNFNGSTIGVAWLSAVCTSFKYHVLQDFTSNANLLRVLVSHEIGHNFSSDHDASGSPFIMAPAVQNTNQWSTQSNNTISSYIVNLDNQGNCLTDCGTNTVLPVANFSANSTEICAGEQVLFTDLSTNATSWSWTFEGGVPATSNQQNPTVRYNVSGSFDVTLVVGNGDGSDDELKVDYIEVSDQPIAFFDYNQNGLDVDFINNSSFGESYFWDFGDGDFSVLENPSHFYDIDGDYLVNLTVTNSCGEESIEMVISIGTPPIADFVSNVITGCPGEVIMFTDLSSPNTLSRSWIFDGGTPATSTELNPIVTYAVSGSFRVQLSVTNNFGDDVLIEPNYITILNDPSADFTSTVIGNDVSFFNFSTDWTTLDWDFGDGTMSNAENPNHSYVQSGVYTVTLTASNACNSDEHTLVVSVGDSPDAAFISDVTTACPNVGIQFTDQSSNNPTQWTWTFEGGQPATSNQQNPVVTYAQSGVYDVSLLASNDLGEDEIVELSYITILEDPVADFVSTIVDNTADFTNLSVNATSYNWDFGDGESSFDPNPLHTYISDGVYNVILTAFNECGSSITESQISVGSVPVSGFTSDVRTACPGDQIQYSAESIGNIDSWSWTFEGGLPATSNEQNPVVTYNQSGVYDVALTVTNQFGMDESIEVDYIVIQSLPIADFNFSVSNTTANFNNLSTNWTSLMWDFGDGATSIEENPLHDYILAGTYNVTLVARNDCGTSTATDMVSIGEEPIANFGSDAILACPGDQIQFFDESINGVVSWAWTFPGGQPSTSSTANPIVTYPSSGTYDVELIVTNGQGDDIEFKESYITVLENPIADFTFNSNSNIFNFINNSSNWSVINWDFGDGNNSAESNPEHTYLIDGDYDVRLNVSNECGEDELIITINVNSGTVVDFANDKNLICTGQSVTYVDNTSPAGSDRTWTFPGGTPETSKESPVTVMYDAVGFYDVKLEIVKNGESFENSKTQLVRVIDVPVVDFNISQLSDTEYQFTDLSDSQTGGYLWNFGDGNTSPSISPIHNYAVPGNYDVSLTITNLCGIDDKTINTNVVLATKNLDQLNGINIYPNPNNGNFFIAWDNPLAGNLNVELFDLLGRTIFNSTNKVDLVDKYILPVEAEVLVGGTYFIRVTHEDKVVVRPLVIQTE